MAKPILKWPGGKRQLLENIYSKFPISHKSYYEPFIGGGAVFFDMEPDEGFINDANPRLINFYRKVRESPKKIIEKCKSFKHPDSEPDPSKEFADVDRKGKEIKCYYYQQRAIFNRRPYDEEYDEVEEASLLLYLNRTCYNGLYRENSDGGFNSPVGRYDNPDWVRSEEVRRASNVLEGTKILNKDFEVVLKSVSENDLIYMDPPYEPMSATADFTNYSEEGFDQSDQKRLLSAVEELDETGAYVMVSNSGVMFEQYDSIGLQVEIEGANRSINSDSSNRGEVDEIIATNVPPKMREVYGQQNLV